MNGPAFPLYCVRDHCSLEYVEKIKVTISKTKDELVFPVFKCPRCGSLYTSVSVFSDRQVFNLSGVRYTNVLPGFDTSQFYKRKGKRGYIIPGTACYLFQGKQPVFCRKCGSLGFTKIKARPIDGKLNISAFVCQKCLSMHMKYSQYRQDKANWTVLNVEEIPSFEEEYLAQKRKQDEKKELKKKRQAEVCETANKQSNKQQRKNSTFEQKQSIIPVKAGHGDNEQREAENVSQKSIRKKNNYNVTIKQGIFSERGMTPEEHDNNIRIKDFVVWRSAFKCRYKEHQLKDIDGMIGLIDQSGIVHQIHIPASYCPNCNVFFILESTYQSIKIRGTLVCRLTDEKTYLSGKTLSNDGIKLARESILRQYGYSVSQTDGLSSARRQKILAILVDNKILTRNEIIGYLDFFISYHNENRYEKAVAKWEEDRDFISNYNAGNYTRYGVRGLHR